MQYYLLYYVCSGPQIYPLPYFLLALYPGGWLMSAKSMGCPPFCLHHSTIMRSPSRRPRIGGQWGFLRSHCRLLWDGPFHTSFQLLTIILSSRPGGFPTSFFFFLIRLDIQHYFLFSYTFVNSSVSKLPLIYPMWHLFSARSLTDIPINIFSFLFVCVC